MRKNRAAVALGRRGGHARARKLTDAQRSHAAAHAANRRWSFQTQQMLKAAREWNTGYVGFTKIERAAPLKVEGPIKLVGYREGDELLSLDQLAARLKISKTTAYGLTRRRAHVRYAHPLPCFKLGKELRFNWSAVIQWLDKLEKGGTV